MYFLLISGVIRASELKMKRWERFEDEKFQPYATPRLSARGMWERAMGAGVINIAETRDEFSMYESLFIKIIRNPRMSTKLGIDEENRVEEISFWRYLTLALRDMLDNLISVNQSTWMYLVLTFVGFSFLHRFYKFTYIAISAVVATAVFSLLAAMALQIVRIKKVYHNSKIKPTEFADEQGISSWDYDHIVTGLLQYSLLLLTYIFARIVGSPFIWDLYPELASTLCLVFIVFYIVFFVLVADLISVFGAMMALPPYITKAKAEHLVNILKMQKQGIVERSSDGFPMNVGKTKSNGIESMRPNPRFTASNTGTSSSNVAGGSYPVGTPPPS
jgi:hypothetical protein